MLELPAEAFEDTLRLEAEVQEAFAEAAARNIPAEHLQAGPAAAGDRRRKAASGC